jgi:ATP-dependent DNA helicase RecG
VIAEKDLEARGPGDLLGTRQSGLPPLRVADPIKDLSHLAEARGQILAMRAEKRTLASDLFGYP